jgi:hypothetical protein
MEKLKKAFLADIRASRSEMDRHVKLVNAQSDWKPAPAYLAKLPLAARSMVRMERLCMKRHHYNVKSANADQLRSALADAEKLDNQWEMLASSTKEDIERLRDELVAALEEVRRRAEAYAPVTDSDPPARHAAMAAFKNYLIDKVGDRNRGRIKEVEDECIERCESASDDVRRNDGGN